MICQCLDTSWPTGEQTTASKLPQGRLAFRRGEGGDGNVLDLHWAPIRSQTSRKGGGQLDYEMIMATCKEAESKAKSQIDAQTKARRSIKARRLVFKRVGARRS